VASADGDPDRCGSGSGDGMLLRHFVFEDGTAVDFVLVATAFLTLFLVGWRLLARRLVANRRP
jgi:hypothetical protein